MEESAVEFIPNFTGAYRNSLRRFGKRGHLCNVTICTSLVSLFLTLISLFTNSWRTWSDNRYKNQLIYRGLFVYVRNSYAYMNYDLPSGAQTVPAFMMISSVLLMYSSLVALISKTFAKNNHYRFSAMSMVVAGVLNLLALVVFTGLFDSNDSKEWTYGYSYAIGWLSGFAAFLPGVFVLNSPRRARKVSSREGTVNSSYHD